MAGDATTQSNDKATTKQRQSNDKATTKQRQSNDGQANSAPVCADERNTRAGRRRRQVARVVSEGGESFKQSKFLSE
mgnify:CR=1 FL=1